MVVSTLITMLLVIGFNTKNTKIRKSSALRGQINRAIFSPTPCRVSGPRERPGGVGDIENHANRVTENPPSRDEVYSRARTKVNREIPESVETSCPRPQNQCERAFSVDRVRADARKR